LQEQTKALVFEAAIRDDSFFHSPLYSCPEAHFGSLEEAKTYYPLLLEGDCFMICGDITREDSDWLSSVFRAIKCRREILLYSKVTTH
jgi:hypothetical protein